MHVFRLQGRAVGARGYWLHDGLAVNGDELRAGFRGHTRHPVDRGRRHVGKLHAGQCHHVPGCLRLPAIAGQGLDETLHVRRTGVVGNGYGRIARDMAPAQQFYWRQNAVAEERVGLKVKEHGFGNQW